jgi:NAD(P)-dependent dehydrogenase (short-subunit alcohol dehydrogenase family)
MSRTIEATSTRDILIQAEPRTNGQRERDACRKLANKVAVITGMGLATAKRFVQEGMDHVFITGRKDALDVAVAEIGDKATGIPDDVASLNDLDRLYESVKGYGRKLDVVFANAGIAQLTPFGTVDEKFYDLHFDANVKGLFFTVQKSLSLLNDGASIILTASIADIKGFPGISVYGATKAAVRSFAVIPACSDPV